MQSESFLEYQRQLHSRCGQDNAQALFGLDKLASVPQIRNVLDGVEASAMSSIVDYLENNGELKTLFPSMIQSAIAKVIIPYPDVDSLA